MKMYTYNDTGEKVIESLALLDLDYTKLDLFFDIETTWRDDTTSHMPTFDESKVKTGNWPKDPEARAKKMDQKIREHRSSFMENAATDAKWGRVGAFTFALQDSISGEPIVPPHCAVAWEDSEEEEVLIYAKELFQHFHFGPHGQIFGFNICGFDLRFMMQRMVLRGVYCHPSIFLEPVKGGGISRYWNHTIMDIRDAWMLPLRRSYDATEGNSLDTLLRLMYGEVSGKLLKGSEIPALIQKADMRVPSYALDEMTKLMQLKVDFRQRGLV
jgi:hypothetical protein